MRVLTGSRDITLLESTADCEAFIDGCDRHVHIYHGCVYENGVIIAITIRAYQKLYADIYP